MWNCQDEPHTRKHRLPGLFFPIFSILPIPGSHPPASFPFARQEPGNFFACNIFHTCAAERIRQNAQCPVPPWICLSFPLFPPLSALPYTLWQTYTYIIRCRVCKRREGLFVIFLSGFLDNFLSVVFLPENARNTRKKVCTLFKWKNCAKLLHFFRHFDIIHGE